MRCNRRCGRRLRHRHRGQGARGGHRTGVSGRFGELSPAQLGLKRLDPALEVRHRLASRGRAGERDERQHHGQEEPDDGGEQKCENHSGYPSLPSASAVADSGHTGVGAAT